MNTRSLCCQLLWLLLTGACCTDLQETVFLLSPLNRLELEDATVYLTGCTGEMLVPENTKVNVDQKEGSLANNNSLVTSQGLVTWVRVFDTETPKHSVVPG